MQEEENIWTLRIEEVEEEDGGEYECQVTHGDGMDARIYKLDVVDEKDSSEIDLSVQPLKTQSDDPISTKPKSESNRNASLVERLKHSDDKLNTSSESSSKPGWSEKSLLLPVISLVTISTVIIILGTVRTVLNKNSDISRHQSRVSVHQSRTSLNKNNNLTRKSVGQSNDQDGPTVSTLLQKNINGNSQSKTNVSKQTL